MLDVTRADSKYALRWPVSRSSMLTMLSSCLGCSWFSPHQQWRLWATDGQLLHRTTGLSHTKSFAANVSCC